MASQMSPHARWENSDNRLHVEDELPAKKARQGHTGRRMLTVLVAALVLAFIVWIPVEIWGGQKSDQAGPAMFGESAITATAPKAADQTPPAENSQHQ